eukprot:4090019-Alexandrium_andersonii.AAC.1
MLWTEVESRQMLITKSCQRCNLRACVSHRQAQSRQPCRRKDGHAPTHALKPRARTTSGDVGATGVAHSMQPHVGATCT